MFALIQSEHDQKISVMERKIDEDNGESVEKIESLQQNISNLEAKIIQLESNRFKKYKICRLEQRIRENGHSNTIRAQNSSLA